MKLLLTCTLPCFELLRENMCICTTLAVNNYRVFPHSMCVSRKVVCGPETIQPHRELIDRSSVSTRKGRANILYIEF